MSDRYTAPMLRALVLAAGASSRMGRPKAGLPLRDGGDTFLSRILRTLVAAGVPDIVVVTGAAPDAVQRAAGPTRRQVRFVHNDAWQQGQLSSLLAGLAAAPDERVEGVMVSLVDAPFTSVETIRAVIRTWRTGRAPIVRPAAGKVHGHPVIFDRVLFDELRGADPQRGAKVVVRAHEHEIVNVPVNDPGAFVDVDIAEDYQRVRDSLWLVASPGAASPRDQVELRAEQAASTRQP